MRGMYFFVNRFGGLTLDNHLTVHYQQLMASPRVHWTEKLALIFNDDHYINQVFVPKYNLMIFLFSFFASFTPFAYLAIPGFFISIQYLFSQAISAGGVRLYVKENGFWKGYGLYIKRFWSLVFTFLGLVPNDAQKTANALSGDSGEFVGGEKDVRHDSADFKTLYTLYREAIKWGVTLLSIMLIAPFHPDGVAAQFFFYAFPFAFLFGPFLKNGFTVRDSLRDIRTKIRNLNKALVKAWEIKKDDQGSKLLIMRRSSIFLMSGASFMACMRFLTSCMTL
jgi:hypothetical protein